MSGVEAICDGCGSLLAEEQIALAFNMGTGPEYYCAKCKPAGTAEDVIKEFDDFMLGTEE